MSTFTSFSVNIIIQLIGIGICGAVVWMLWNPTIHQILSTQPITFTEACLLTLCCRFLTHNTTVKS